MYKKALKPFCFYKIFPGSMLLLHKAASNCYDLFPIKNIFKFLIRTIIYKQITVVDLSRKEMKEY